MREAVIDSALQGALEIGDEVLRVGARHDLHQLPALLAVVVEDLLGRVDQQRNGQVLPAGLCAHGPSLPGSDRGEGAGGPSSAPGSATQSQPPAADCSTRRSTAPQSSMSGCLRSRRRRSRSVMPPHTPKSTRLSRASARPSVRTGHAPHAVLTACCSAPCTKKPSGSMLTQAPRVAQLESLVTGFTPILIPVPFRARIVIDRTCTHCKETGDTVQNDAIPRLSPGGRVTAATSPSAHGAERPLGHGPASGS